MKNSISYIDILNFGFALVALLISGLTAYWQFLRKPKIEIIYEDDEPYRKFLHHNDKRSDNFEWFVRAKVINKKKMIAKKCFGKITEWYINNEKVKIFDPIKLHWVSNSPSDYSDINLSYQEFDYLDLFLTLRKQEKIAIYTNTHLRGIPVDFDWKDEHIFKIVVYCENEAHVFKYLKTWYQAEDTEEKFRLIRVTEINKRDYKKILKSK